MTAGWGPWGIQAQPTVGHNGLSSASAKTRASSRVRCAQGHRRPAKRSTRRGSSSFATRWGRCHPQATSWLQRRLVSAETVIPRLVCHVRARGAQLQRVRHPPRRPRGRLAQGDPRAPPRGSPHGAAYRRNPRPMVVGLPPAATLPRGAHGVVHARARAEQDGGDVRWGTSRRAPPHDVAGQQGAVARAAAPPASRLTRPWASQRRCWWASQGLLDTRICGHIQWMSGGPRCANLLWNDLVLLTPTCSRILAVLATLLGRVRDYTL